MDKTKALIKAYDITLEVHKTLNQQFSPGIYTSCLAVYLKTARTEAHLILKDIDKLPYSQKGNGVYGSQEKNEDIITFINNRIQQLEKQTQDETINS